MAARSEASKRRRCEKMCERGSRGFLLFWLLVVECCGMSWSKWQHMEEMSLSAIGIFLFASFWSMLVRRVFVVARCCKSSHFTIPLSVLVSISLVTQVFVQQCRVWWGRQRSWCGALKRSFTGVAGYPLLLDVVGWSNNCWWSCLNVSW